MNNYIENLILNKVDKLNLRNKNLGFNEVGPITKLLTTNNMIRELNLSNNEIDSGGAVEILRSNTILLKFNLSNNNIEPNGVVVKK